MNIRIIPKIDIKNFNLVKGVHLEGLRVLGDPKNFADQYYREGADELIYHDVVASLYQQNNISNLVKRTSKNIFLPMVVGGGIDGIEQVEKILKSGADRIFINSSAIDKPNLIDDIVKHFGSSTLVVSIEFVNIDGKFMCRKDFGREETDKNLIDWAKETLDRGAGELLLTSIDRDGTGSGYDLKASEKIAKYIKSPYILNGGISSLKDIGDILDNSHPSGLAIGSVLHYNNLDSLFSKMGEEGNIDFIKKKTNYKNFKKITIKQIKEFIENKVSHA